MIPSAKLSDFQENYLHFYIEVMTEKAEDYNRKLAIAEEYKLQYHIEEYAFKRDAALLLVVQLQNAVAEVEAMEKINNH